jgi:hypothetical protein
MSALLDLLFGCWHTRYSFPQNDGRGDYVACLECGSEFDYDFDQMRIGERRPKSRRLFVAYEAKTVERILASVEARRK